MKKGLYLDGEVDELFYGQIVDAFSDGRKAMVMDTPGGTLHYGLQAKDYIAGIKGAHVHVIGLCASAGTVILQGAERRTASPNARFMIHNPIGTMQGNADQIDSKLEALKKEEERLFLFYEKHLSIKGEELRNQLASEEIVTAQRALELGLIDEIININMAEFEKETSFMDKIMTLLSGNQAKLDKIEAKMSDHLGIKAMTLTTTDMTTEVDFGEEIVEETQIAVGLEGVMVDGEPANGSYDFPTFSVVIENGVITEKMYKNDEGEEEMEETMEEVIAKLKESNEMLSAQIEANKQKDEEIQALKSVESKYNDLKGLAEELTTQNKSMVEELKSIKNVASKGEPSTIIENQNKEDKTNQKHTFKVGRKII